MNGQGNPFKIGYKVKDPSEDSGIKPYCSKRVGHGGKEEKRVGVVNIRIECEKKRERWRNNCGSRLV